MCYLEYFDYSEVHYKILEDLEDLEDLEGLKDPEGLKILGESELADKLFDLTEKINDIINIKSYKI